jgi:hypothetical protein
MVRSAEVAIWVVTIPVAVALVVTYTGVAAAVVTPSQLPGGPTVGIGASVALVVIAVVTTQYWRARSWRAMGRSVGLEPTESNPLGRSDLEGVVDDRPIRVSTYSTSGGSSGSSDRYTTVTTELDHPVEWTAMLASQLGVTGDTVDVGEAETNLSDLESIVSVTVDDYVVRGDLPAETARSLLTPRVRDALDRVYTPVSVGDVERTITDAVLDSASDDGGIGHAVASGLLDAVQDGDEGPTTEVTHRDEGTPVDAADLRRRTEAVVAVAIAVELADERA